MIAPVPFPMIVHILGSCNLQSHRQNGKASRTA
jgi:hypothetical protein